MLRWMTGSSTWTQRISRALNGSRETVTGASDTRMARIWWGCHFVHSRISTTALLAFSSALTHASSASQLPCRDVTRFSDLEDLSRISPRPRSRHSHLCQTRLHALVRFPARPSRCCHCHLGQSIEMLLFKQEECASQLTVGSRTITPAQRHLQRRHHWWGLPLSSYVFFTFVLLGFTFELIILCYDWSLSIFITLHVFGLFGRANLADWYLWVRYTNTMQLAHNFFLSSRYRSTQDPYVDRLWCVYVDRSSVLYIDLH